MSKLVVNGAERDVVASTDTPLLYVLRNELGLTSPKFGCGMALWATDLDANKVSLDKLDKRLGNIDTPLDESWHELAASLAPAGTGFGAAAAASNPSIGSSYQSADRLYMTTCENIEKELRKLTANVAAARKQVDMRSDTVTKPTSEMRAAMALTGVTSIAGIDRNALVG